MKPNSLNERITQVGVVAAIALSAWALNAQRGLDKKLESEIARLGNGSDVADLGSKVAAMSRRIGRLEGQAEPSMPHLSQGTDANGATGAPDGGSLSDNLKTVARMDPGLLESLQQKFSKEQAARQQVDKLRVLRQNQQKADVEKYGAAIQDLTRRISAGGTDADAAYSELLAKYPDSNAAAAAIGEMGLTAAMDMKTSDVESYFSQLMSQPGGTEAVTEQGYQAAPALHSYLARTYIAEGKYDQARQIIDSITQNYSNDLIPERGNGNEPQWITGSELASQLNTAVSNASSGLPGAPGGSSPPPPGN